MAGRPRKPRTLRLLEGNPSGRPIPDEPIPADFSGPAPMWLPMLARQEWERVVPELQRLRLLTELDTTALAGYCVAFAEFVEATRVLEERGTTYVVGTNGAIAQRPEVGIRHRAAQLMRQFANEFGMTPAARSKVSVEPQDDTNNPFAGGMTP